MLISLHDNYQRRIAHIDNALPKAMHYNDDKWNRNLAYGTGIFEFTIDIQDLEHESQLVVGNYVSFRYNNRDYMFTILRSEKSSDDKKIIVHSEYLSLGLLKSTQDQLDPPQSHTLEWYLTQSGILVNSGIKLGINEVPDLVRKIKIDGEQTALQRLTSFATNFGAEIEYVTTLNRDGTLKSLVVNFYKKFDGVNQGVGTNRQDLTLSYGKNVSGIKQTTDITDFFSMITPTGKDGLTITSLDRTEYDDKGNVLFFTKPGQSSIYAPQSAQRFPSRLIRTNNDYTDHKYSADGTSDQNTLYTLALNELKKHCDPSIVYDVTGFYDLNIGDTVKIFDASFNPPLMLQARVAEQTISFSNPSNNKTVFGNIIALESQASQELTSRLKELVEQATPYRFEIVSDNGMTFKNNEGNTTLTARVYKGSNIDEVSVDSFEWLIDGVPFGDTAKYQLVNASQVTGTSVVRYNAKIGDTVIGGLEVTLQDISDGVTHYPHTAWAYSSDGTDRFTTVYPNLNLLSQNDLIPGYIDRNGVLIPPSTEENERTSRFLEVDANQNYTAQFFVTLDIQKSSWCAISWFDENKTFIERPAFQESSVPISGNYTYHYTVKPPSNAKFVRISFNKWEDGKLKLEQSSTATHWMPSASEVTTADWPNYIGQYSDFTQADSTTPSDYTWGLIRGEDGKTSYAHTAYAYSADGTDRFTTVYPNLNLLDGTKDFSGTWSNSSYWVTDGTYKGLTVKKRTAPWQGIYKTFTALKDGKYTFSAYIKSSGDANISRVFFINGVQKATKWFGNDSDWIRDKITVDLKAGDVTFSRYEITTSNANCILWNAGHKWEFDSIVTPYMLSDSEVKTSDYPSYIGTYSDNNINGSTDPSKYTWAVFKGVDGQNGISPTVTVNPDTSLTIVDAQGTSTTPALKGADGTDGTSGIIVSSVAPDSPQTGQLWQDTSTTPQIVKKWTGNEWVIWKMYVENMAVDTISSMSSDLGDVSAGTVKLMADVDVNGTLKKHGIYQSKMGLLSSGPSLATPSTLSNSQMGVANLNRGELRFIVTDYTEDLKNVQETGMSDPNTAFIQFNSYDNGKDVMLIGSSGDIVFKGITSQDTPWIALGNGAYYKNMFSRVYISYSVTATSTANIPLGVLPVGLRPFRGLHLTANAWAATLVNDRHIEVRTTGEVMLYNPANGASYDGEVSFTL